MKPFVERRIDIDGVDIHYAESNISNSQTILCLHALGHSLKDYSRMFESTEFNDYRIVAVDFPGHGGSSEGQKPVSSAYYAELTEKFIYKLQLKRITILGNSIGGAVAIRLASKCPDEVTSIQLANPAGLDKGGFISKLFLSFMVWFFKKGTSLHPKFKKWFKYYYNKVLPSPEATERRNEIISDAYKIAPLLVEGWNSFKLSSENLKEIVSHLSCPVLVTWAMKDKKVQYKRNVKSIRKIKNLRLIKYNIGHTPMLENSKEFLTDLKRFLTPQEEAIPSRHS